MCMTWNQSFAVKMLPCKASVKLLLNCCFINYHLSITLWPHFQYSPRWKPISLSSSQLLTSDPGSPYPSSLLLQDWMLSYSGSLPLFFILSNFCFVFFISCKMFLSNCKAMPTSSQFSFRSWSRHGRRWSTQPPSLPQDPTWQQRLAIPVKQMNEAMFSQNKSYLETP